MSSRQLNRTGYSLGSHIWLLLRFRTPTCWGVLTILLALASWTSIQAQSTATLRGQVSDPGGAVVPGALVTVSLSATAELRSSRTDEDGFYQVAALSAGTYEIDVQARGF